MSINYVPTTDQLPVVVVGAGPIGLAAAAHLVERGLEPLVLEAGPSAGTAVRAWAHVRLFSPWAEVTDPAAEKLLAPTGWIRPDGTGYPTGGDWAEQYLQPLADVLGDQVRYGATVTGVARAGRDRIVDSGRDEQPFTVHVQLADGREERITARAVIDASGTWSTPGPMGADGLPALGEKAASDHIAHRVPDLGDPAVRARYAGKRTAVIGSGASAFTALAYLADLAKEEDGTHAAWILRRGIGAGTYGGGEADELPARGALGLRAKEAVEAGHASTVTGFRTRSVERDADGRLVLVAEDGRRLNPVDEVIVLTGFRPDLSFLSELRLGLDERLQAPTALAPLIDPNVHSCGTVYPHGVNELAHPEKDIYLVGMKSYGRAPTFLAMTGYEQVRSITASLAGDQEAAERVELTLPETGVCGGAGLFDDPDAAQSSEGGGCCAAPATLQIGVAAPAVTAGGC
ncbi:FAD-dependent oxidoreductase [Streptomyces caniscabiei]|uniref:NAD(P)-binding domain-containing protein n=1 Tax=Streptomyces caniscabiei TaxID=2746961 RepID=A0A927QRP9_9ACTN|nr:FAD-dependent oxidoreductase [Streptomyces caniscabiei]MBD9704526.1 NAD(P)-binding domain-containing protein [Streptomyces caniscabiei]MBD9729734.1 NAD(P)-binding domain-containing protein [Streptomyces caniscabiei]MDX3516087.1 FAD-dependent oxidoreductase [Streptomyces caniscabiei]MDX3724540.1 FAD-dependent oxidoreductase [Streptomyces caniscabiei]MDX3733147.1 FAD-dependent oxidoreductase [Streptomyces caniscabiei]